MHGDNSRVTVKDHGGLRSLLGYVQKDEGGQRSVAATHLHCSSTLGEPHYPNFTKGVSFRYAVRITMEASPII